jgi:hypothetical protein
MGDLVDTSSWFDLGASAPPPDAQPTFNSPVTQDSFTALNSTPSIFDSAAAGLQSIISSGAGVLTTLSGARAQTNAASQAVQLSQQQTQSSQAVVLAQSTAQQKSAQVNANIASAIAQFTASPLVLAVLATLVLFLIAKKIL